jgi:hypothetical protein
MEILIFEISRPTKPAVGFYLWHVIHLLTNIGLKHCLESDLFLLYILFIYQNNLAVSDEV